MKIIADENMPGVAEWFSSYGEVTCLPGREILAENVVDADVLLVRSVTNIDEALLKQSSVKFVGSATIGIDHVDGDYLASCNIYFSNAPGCNANAVVEYVLSCLASLQSDWQTKQIAVIGCGNVGGKLLNLFHRLGIDALGCDPFLNQRPDYMVDLQQALACDIICLHTPLTREGEHPTFHLLNHKTLAQVKDGALLINAGRGEVVDSQALLGCLRKNRFRCVLDVWENEPQINTELLDAVDLATPHIAGYSLDGKVAGTRMVFEAFLNWMGEEASDFKTLEITRQTRKITTTSINDAILQAYDVRKDDRLLRASPGEFDRLRKNYRHRLEFSHYQVELNEQKDSLRKSLQQLGFVC